MLPHHYSTLITNLASNSRGVECHLASRVVIIDLELLALLEVKLAFDKKINTVAHTTLKI